VKLRARGARGQLFENRVDAITECSQQVWVHLGATAGSHSGHGGGGGGRGAESGEKREKKELKV
jgi:hypothetical protein